MLDILEQLKEKLGFEATRAVSRGWYEEAQNIAEEIDDPAKRWAILLAAMRQMGWPRKEYDDG